MIRQRHWAQRVRNMIAVVLVACGVMAVSATVASAEGSCSGNSAYVLCFYIEPAGGDQYDVYVDIDFIIGRPDAEAILAQPGDPVDAWAIGDDWFDNAEFRIPLTTVFAGDDGLGAQFHLRVLYAALDEDPDGADELYARVRLYDTRVATRTYTSDVLTSPFT